MRLAFISDIHEDYLSLKKILRKIRLKGFDKLICLGDISGFSKAFYKYHSSRDAPACLNLLREHCDSIVLGNHDLHAAGRIPEHSAVFDFPENWYELETNIRQQLTSDQLWLHHDDLDPGYSHEDLKYLRSLPEYQIMKTPEYNILLSHYAYPNLSGFKKGFYSWEKEFGAHFSFMKKHQCSLGFTGHAHPRGYYVVSKDKFRQYALRSRKIRELPAIIGISPVTRHKQRRGFCIFDTEKLIVNSHR